LQPDNLSRLAETLHRRFVIAGDAEFAIEIDPRTVDDARAAARGLAAAGYVPIGLDHFARPQDPLVHAAADGTLRRNFQGYTADPAGALLGFGASAIGSLPAGYLQNHADLKAYDAAVRAGHLPTVRGLEVTREDCLRAAVIERLMCTLGADVGAVCCSLGFPANQLDDALSRVKSLVSDGLVEVAGRRVAVPEHARLLIRNVAACFDAYIQSSEAAARTGRLSRRLPKRRRPPAA
jgi:oxygen-independent coproporphyrinogen III oxidase